eukprot:1137770-Pelagomonas_calceolata.AAC.14
MDAKSPSNRHPADFRAQFSTQSASDFTNSIGRQVDQSKRTLTKWHAPKETWRRAVAEATPAVWA